MKESSTVSSDSDCKAFGVAEARRILDRTKSWGWWGEDPALSDLELARGRQERCLGALISSFGLFAYFVLMDIAPGISWLTITGIAFAILSGAHAMWGFYRLERVRRLFERHAPQNLSELPLTDLQRPD